MEFLAWCCLIPALYYSVVQKKWLLPNKTVLYTLAGFFITAIISYFLNQGQLENLGDYIVRMRWIIFYLGFLQFFNIFYDKIRFHHVFYICQILSIITAFYAFYQMIYAKDLFRDHHVVFHSLYENSLYFRPNGFFNLPTTFAYSITMFFCLQLARSLQPYEKFSTSETWVNRLYLILQPLVIMSTFTRAAWMCLISVTIALVALTKKRLLVPLVILIVSSLVGLYIFSSNFSNRVNSITDMTYEGNYHRLHLWNAYLHMFQDYPVFGTGLGKNRDLLEIYLQKLGRQDVLRSHPHNTYINILSSVGLIGFFFFLLFIADHLFLALKGFIQAKNKIPQISSLFVGILGLQMVLLLGGLTECTFKDTELTHQYILFIALAKFLSLRFIRKEPEV